eukprot:971446-Pyramimonas_sp.AAC.1
MLPLLAAAGLASGLRRCCRGSACVPPSAGPCPAAARGCNSPVTAKVSSQPSLGQRSCGGSIVRVEIESRAVFVASS